MGSQFGTNKKQSVYLMLKGNLLFRVLISKWNMRSQMSNLGISVPMSVFFFIDCGTFAFENVFSCIDKSSFYVFEEHLSVVFVPIWV